VQDLLADLAGTHSHNEFNKDKRIPLKVEHLALYKEDLAPALSKAQLKEMKKARSVWIFFEQILLRPTTTY